MPNTFLQDLLRDCPDPRTTCQGDVLQLTQAVLKEMDARNSLDPGEGEAVFVLCCTANAEPGKDFVAWYEATSDIFKVCAQHSWSLLSAVCRYGWQTGAIPSNILTPFPYSPRPYDSWLHEQERQDACDQHPIKLTPHKDLIPRSPQFRIKEKSHKKIHPSGESKTRDEAIGRMYAKNEDEN